MFYLAENAEIRRAFHEVSCFSWFKSHQGAAEVFVFFVAKSRRNRLSLSKLCLIFHPQKGRSMASHRVFHNLNHSDRTDYD